MASLRFKKISNSVGGYSGFILPGFTLAELLVALAILGVIATFTIPKVLTAQQNGQKQAVIKETVAALNDITYQAVVKQDGLTPSTFYDYYRDRLNYKIACPNDINTEGCWTQPYTSPNGFAFQGFKLSNGATLASFTVCCDYGDGVFANVITVDWNGAQPPNVYGDDQFDLRISWGSAPFVTGPATYRPGTVLPDYDEAASVAVFNDTFK